MNLSAITTFLSEQGIDQVDIAVVLGSGLKEFVHSIKNSVRIPIQDIPEYPSSDVQGHEGALYYGSIGTNRILAFSGRLHTYEGHTFEEAALPALISKELGASLFIATNAAGGINPLFCPGDFMLITEYLVSPVAMQEFGRFMTSAKDIRNRRNTFPSEKYLDSMYQNALNQRINVRAGTYAFVLGPSYETKAEIHMLHAAGADAVGMSTVPELIAASCVELSWLGISCITNKAAGTHGKITHDDVTHAANQNGNRLSALLHSFILNYRAEDNTQ